LNHIHNRRNRITPLPNPADNPNNPMKVVRFVAIAFIIAVALVYFTT
jgi:hypothetical protein